MDLGSNRRIPTHRPDDFRKLIDQEILGCDWDRTGAGGPVLSVLLKMPSRF